MIQKLEYETHKDGNGNVYGAIPSDAEIIAKVNEVIDYINSLPDEKPIEKDEEMEALIACDIMEATVKRVNIDKQDKDKEEEAMLEKIHYLRNLGLNAKEK